MFRFFRNLFTKWKRRKFSALPESIDLYSPEERLLYGYWNGNRYVFQDPMVLYKRVMEVGPELSIDIQVANSPIKGNIEASKKLMDKIRKIFDIEPYDPAKPNNSGLTEIGLSGLLTHFLTYSDIVKKNVLGSPPPQTISVPTASPAPSAQEESPPTPPTSDTTSTEETPNTDTPTPPPSEQESPSDSLSPPLIILGPTQMERETPS